MRCRALELSRVIASAKSSRDKNERVVLIRDALLSQEDETSPVTVTTSDGEGEGSSRCELVERREQRSVFSLSL